MIASLKRRRMKNPRIVVMLMTTSNIMTRRSPSSTALVVKQLSARKEMYSELIGVKSGR
jgi:hypothetical protein